MKMDLSRAVFSISLFIAVVAAGETAAQGSLEIIPLRHRTAEQVLPTLRPLMEPGATLTGQGTQLIVRTSPANLAELKRALEELDRPRGRITNRGSSVDVRLQDRQSAATERVDQRLQVLEGGHAFISTGTSTPVYDGSGFRETSRLSTTVSGRLGQWLDIGGAVEAASRDESGILSARSSGSARTGRIWLKVDELRP